MVGQQDAGGEYESDGARIGGMASRAAAESTYLRTVISRYGGMIKQGHAVQIPPQTWNTRVDMGGTTSYLQRHPAKNVVVGSGVPGYMGYVPHGEMPAKPSLLGASTSPQRYHATDYRAMDRTMMPRRMPIVGYRGHLRNTKESTQCYGVSHWRSTAPPTRAAAASLAFENARSRAEESLPDPLLSA